MKKQILKAVAVLSITVMLTSCASALTGTMSSSASLSDKNFSYAQQNVQGKAQATYVLGIGGMNREAIVNEAKQNMLANTPLKSNQALANLSVDFKYSNFLALVTTVRCYVTADIVEFK